MKDFFRFLGGKRKFLWAALSLLAVVVLIALTICVASINERLPLPKNRDKIGEVRSVPYPFKSMLAVCSDIDGTTLREFILAHKYLNTTEDSYLGEGLGLDIADSFWMFAVNDDGAVIDYDGAQNASAMSYFRPGAQEIKNSKEIIKYFKNGWIDSIHSYGDFSRVDTKSPVFTKGHAEIANKEMLENGLLPTIWINHGNEANVQNMRKEFSSPKLWYQKGADKKSEYYHADITVAAGIRYVWFSNPSAQYAVDTPIYPAKLQDGQRVWGFSRYTGENKYFGVFGHEYNWSSYDFNEQVSEKRLDELAASGGVAVISQHLGAADGDYVFTGATKEGFERLKRYEENGDIVVARTSRLLDFVRTRDYLRYEYADDGSEETIRIYSIDDPVLGAEIVSNPDQLMGISFNVRNPEKAKIFINNDLLEDEMLLLRIAAGEQNGVIGFKWYEKDLTDYTFNE